MAFPPPHLVPLLKEVGSLLRKRKELVAVVDTASGGLISALLLSQPGASSYYGGGITAYTLSSRVKFLGWEQKDIDGYRCVAASPVFLPLLTTSLPEVQRKRLSLISRRMPGLPSARRGVSRKAAWQGRRDHQSTPMTLGGRDTARSRSSGHQASSVPRQSRRASRRERRTCWLSPKNRSKLYWRVCRISKASRTKLASERARLQRELQSDRLLSCWGGRRPAERLSNL